MIRLFGLALLSLLLFACAPYEHTAETLACTKRLSQEQLLADSWLQKAGVWRLRQSALLELGQRKIPLQGLLRLDTLRHEARLVAMNEMGVVLFDLELDGHGQTLHRAIPQLQQQPEFAVGVAESLRLIFLQPSPRTDDHLQLRSSSQRLWRLMPGGSLGFIFDCYGNRQETLLVSDTGNWQVKYLDYQPYADWSIPRQIVFNDYQHGVKLSLWLSEVKRENE